MRAGHWGGGAEPAVRGWTWREELPGGEQGGGGQRWSGGSGTAWELCEETAVWDGGGDGTLWCLGTNPPVGLRVPGLAKAPTLGVSRAGAAEEGPQKSLLGPSAPSKLLWR